VNEREFQEIKNLLAQLSNKIDALYDPAPVTGPISDFELETSPDPEEKPIPETPAPDPDNAAAKPTYLSAGTVGELFSDMARRPTVADSLAKTRKKGPLKERIPLNDRFLYMKTLFSGDNSLYEKTLTDLQSMDNMQQAEKYLALHFPSWELSTPAVQKFLSQLENVF
jgi:hypothetical protein